jgi:hypothetical protein
MRIHHTFFESSHSKNNVTMMIRRSKTFVKLNQIFRDISYLKTTNPTSQILKKIFIRMPAATIPITPSSVCSICLISNDYTDFILIIIMKCHGRVIKAGWLEDDDQEI